MLQASDRLRIVARACAGVAIVCGASGIIGWAFGIRRFLSMIEGAPGLMPLGAFGLLAAGMALICATWRPAYGQLLGIVVASICLLGGLGYLIGHDFGLGDLPAGVIRGAGTLPGLSAPSSIVALGFIGFALVTMARAPVLAQGAALVALTIAYLAALAELFGASMTQGVSAYTAMSPQAIVSMIALAVGILCTTPDAGVMPLLMDSGVAGLAVRRFLPIAIILPLVLGGLRVAGELAGMFDTRFGTALMAVASAALAGILTIASTARAPSPSRRAASRMTCSRC